MKKIFNRSIIYGLMISLQFLSIVLIILWLCNISLFAKTVLGIITILTAVKIINSNSNPSVKLAWVFFLFLFRYIGGIVYLLFGTGHAETRMYKKMSSLRYEKGTERINRPNIGYTHLTNSNMPPYLNTQSTYYQSGEAAFDSIKEALEMAENFILIEFFIISPGKMWSDILEILKRKVQSGVNVKVMYDGVGSLKTLPFNYKKKLEKMGIECVVFSDFVPTLSITLNNRDHRKIIVVDNKIAFTGGINIADEYINKVKKYGYWKDCAIKIEGDAVIEFTLIFYELWNYSNFSSESYNVPVLKTFKAKGNGIVQPYSSNPFDNKLKGKCVYLDIINKARKYIYISTPYFVVDNEIMFALELAVKNGIDVRIIVPQIFDHWYIRTGTLSYLNKLVTAGIKVYRYIPGFIHAKMFIADDEILTVGSVNLDYRSLYHHFECGVVLINTQTVLEAKLDYEKAMEKSERIPDNLKIPWHDKLMNSLSEALSPLL